MPDLAKIAHAHKEATVIISMWNQLATLHDDASRLRAVRYLEALIRDMHLCPVPQLDPEDPHAP